MKLTVSYLGGDTPELVGELFDLPSGEIQFEYDSIWAAGRRELSPLFLPNDTRGPTSTPTPEFGQLFGLFNDCLPDWWGRRLMEKYFLGLGIPWERVTALQKLSCQGIFGLGALGFEPDLLDSEYRSHLPVTIGDLVEGAVGLASGRADVVINGLIRSGLSVGGAQPKVLLGFSEDFSETVAGGGGMPEGYSPWLLKFDLDPELEVGKEEYAYSLMARAAGIDMPETRLLVDGKREHFVVRRFDTAAKERFHMHSYSGLMHLPVRNTIDYDDMLDVTRTLTRDEREVEKFFRRAVFNVVAGNEDDHGRNHAFLMDEDGDWTLSPAYDLTRSYNALVGGMRAGAVLGNATKVTRDDLRRLGDGQGVRRVDVVIDEVVSAVREWPRWADEAGLSDFRTGHIRDELALDEW